MSLETVYNELSKNLDDSYYIKLAEKEVMLIPVIIDTIQNNNNIQYGQWAEALLERISEKTPDLVYPYLTYIADELPKVSFVSWNIWKIISNLLSCDYQNKWHSIREKYYQALNSEKIAEFSIACDCAEKIVLNKPQEKDNILSVLKNMDNRVFKIAGKPSDGCLKVAKEKALETLEKLNIL